MEESITLDELGALLERIRKDEYNAQREQSMFIAKMNNRQFDPPTWEEHVGKVSSFEDVRNRAMEKLSGMSNLPGFGVETE